MDSFSLLLEDDVCKIIIRSLNATCSLDYIPIWLVKQSPDVLTPVIILMVILSIQEGWVPGCWKSTIVVPLLKKAGLDSILKNFRPVSNLPFVSKVVEQAVVCQLLTPCTINMPLPENQFSYHTFPSTERMESVQSDILMAVD